MQVVEPLGPDGGLEESLQEGIGPGGAEVERGARLDPQPGADLAIRERCRTSVSRLGPNVMLPDVRLAPRGDHRLERLERAAFYRPP